jgi:hypothetical protein
MPACPIGATIRWSCTAFATLVLCACADTPGAGESNAAGSTPATSAERASASAAGRAAAGDTVWVILNYVKPDGRAEFERFLHEVFWPAGRRVGERDAAVARTFAQTRILHPTQPNADGTWTYAFLMDPRISGADYDILSLLKRAYPAAEAERHMAAFTGALAREGDTHLLVQSPD